MKKWQKNGWKGFLQDTDASWLICCTVSVVLYSICWCYKSFPLVPCPTVKRAAVRTLQTGWVWKCLGLISLEVNRFLELNFSYCTKVKTCSKLLFLFRIEEVGQNVCFEITEDFWNDLEKKKQLKDLLCGKNVRYCMFLLVKINIDSLFKLCVALYVKTKITACPALGWGTFIIITNSWGKYLRLSAVCCWAGGVQQVHQSFFFFFPLRITAVWERWERTKTMSWNANLKLHRTEGNWWVHDSSLWVCHYEW